MRQVRVKKLAIQNRSIALLVFCFKSFNTMYLTLLYLVHMSLSYGGPICQGNGLTWVRFIFFVLCLQMLQS